MKSIDRVPIRHIAAVLAVTICAYLSAASHYKAIAQQDPYSIGWGVPPPPSEVFAEALLATPGVLAGIPLIVMGATGELDWLTRTGVVLGAGFFWYCVGWYVDWSRDLSPEPPPKIVAGYMRALTVVAAILFPLGVLAGFNVGSHVCAVGAPPAWSELVGYSILMFWISLGTFFTWLRFQARRNPNDPSHLKLLP